MSTKTPNLGLIKPAGTDYVNITDLNTNFTILDKLGGDYIVEKKIQKAAGKWSYVCFQNSGLMIQWMVDWPTGKSSEAYSKYGTNSDALHCTRKFTAYPSYAKPFAQEPWSQWTFSGSGVKSSTGTNPWTCWVATHPSSATRQKAPNFQLIDAYNANKSIPSPTFSCLAIGFWK